MDEVELFSYLPAHLICDVLAIELVQELIHAGCWAKVFDLTTAGVAIGRPFNYLAAEVAPESSRFAYAHGRYSR